MQTASVVVGGAFGDEGKGVKTDYLSSKYNEDCCVIRYNGGAQAGHTVELPDGTRHVFHHFGCGTFNGSPTFLSKHFIVNPILFRTEWETLSRMGYTPTVFVDERCPVTIPYDMLTNQLVEEIRSGGRHGSCGMGINETITRTYEHKSFKVVDFYDHPAEYMDTYKNKVPRYLANIRYEYYPQRLKNLGIIDIPENYKNLFMNDNLIKRYIDDIEFFKAHTLVTNELGIKDRFNHVVFEGAQGLLLDEESVFYPNVTRSKTGINNVLELSKIMDIKNLNVYYMTRGYTTKHGAGVMPYELSEKPYKNIVDKTNINNEWQGSLRFSYLNIDLLTMAIQKDLSIDTKGIFISPEIVITCIDQLDSTWKYIWNNEIETIHKDMCISVVRTKTKLPVDYYSNGATRNDIHHI